MLIKMVVLGVALTVTIVLLYWISTIDKVARLGLNID